MFFLFFHKTDTDEISVAIPSFPCPNCGYALNPEKVFKIVHKGFFLLIPYRFTIYKVFCPNCNKMVKLPKDLKGYVHDY